MNKILFWYRQYFSECRIINAIYTALIWNKTELFFIQTELLINSWFGLEPAKKSYFMEYYKRNYMKYYYYSRNNTARTKYTYCEAKNGPTEYYSWFSEETGWISLFVYHFLYRKLNINTSLVQVRLKIINKHANIEVVI